MRNLFPGATIGIIGNDNMARDMAIAAKIAGYNVAVLAKDADSLALSVADFKFVATKNSRQAEEEFFGLATMVTYSSEWVPENLIDDLKAEEVPQGTDMLELTADHALSRAFLESQSMNVLPYELVSTLEEAGAAGVRLGFPVSVKPIFKHGRANETVILRGSWDLGLVAPLIDGGTLIVQSWLDGAHEYELTAVRNVDGGFDLYPLRETAIDEQFMHRSWTVGDINDDFYEEVASIVRRVGEGLSYVGAYSVSFLYSTTGNLYVRDVVPGVTPTNKLYDVATNVPVVEQHIRAITGQSLASVVFVAPAVMMPFTDAQIPDLQRHWQIKPDWHVQYFNNPHMAPQAGIVLASSGASSRDILMQMQVAGVWLFKL
jgi:5-(carboxyamino)imidazole ribonucleotide synthase